MLRFLLLTLFAFLANSVAALHFSTDGMQAQAKISPSDLAGIAQSVRDEAASRVQQFRANASCGSCSRGVNYDACPNGYDMARSGECSPSSYSGLCNASTDFSSFTETEKAEAESICGFCFPCA